MRMGLFSKDLSTLAEHPFKDRLTVGEIEAVLQGRGFASLILVLCLPFIQPIPLPGLSMIFGAAIIALGARLALGKRARLPEFARRRELDAETLRKIVASALKVFAYVERFFRPRISVMLTPPFRNIIGVSIMLSGLALSLPLPPVILFSNALPAWAIMCLCLGFLEEDGLFIVIGHVLTVVSWVYFAFWWEVISAGVEHFLY